MTHDLTHASFFSGVGGLDMGLERAGWRTVSFSEIDPYASAVLAQRWPGVPNLGSIVDLVDRRRIGQPPEPAGLVVGGDGSAGRPSLLPGGTATADLWTGGFPCQDLSVAGKRRGMVEGTRSNLAYAFLDLVERHRPPAVLLENVPGLLSSHAGRDFGALLGTLGQLGYGWAYRVLDARHFGVPQRRRRVFILGIHARIDPSGLRAAEVLSVGTRCGWHPATGHETGEGTAAGTDVGTHGVVADGATSSRTVQSAFGHHGYTLGAQDVDGGYLQVTNTLRVGSSGPGSGGSGHALPIVFDWQQGHGEYAPSSAESQALSGSKTPAVFRPSPDPDRDGAPDGLAGRSHHRDGVAATLPLGLDSHRYRCCGNGVVSSIAEWIGLRLANALQVEAAA